MSCHQERTSEDDPPTPPEKAADLQRLLVTHELFQPTAKTCSHSGDQLCYCSSPNKENATRQFPVSSDTRRSDGCGWVWPTASVSVVVDDDATWWYYQTLMNDFWIVGPWWYATCGPSSEAACRSLVLEASVPRNCLSVRQPWLCGEKSGCSQEADCQTPEFTLHFFGGGWATGSTN